MKNLDLDKHKYFIEALELMKDKYNLHWQQMADIIGIHLTTIHAWKNYNSSYFYPPDKKLPLYISNLVRWLKEKGDDEMADLIGTVDTNSSLVQDIKINKNYVEQTITLLLDRLSQIETTSQPLREQLKLLDDEAEKITTAIGTLREINKQERLPNEQP